MFKKKKIYIYWCDTFTLPLLTGEIHLLRDDIMGENFDK